MTTKLNKKNTDPCLKQIMTLEELQNSNCLKFYNVTPLDDPKLQKFIKAKYINLKDYIETNHNAIYEKNKNGCFELVNLEDVKLIKDPSPFDYFIIESIGRYRPDYDENSEDITNVSRVHFDNATINMMMHELYYDVNDKACYTYYQGLTI